MHGQNIYSYAFIAVLFPLYHACDHDVLYNSMEQAEQPDLKGHCLTGLSGTGSINTVPEEYSYRSRAFTEADTQIVGDSWNSCPLRKIVKRQGKCKTIMCLLKLMFSL